MAPPAEEFMERGAKQKLWESLMDYQNGVIVQRIGTAVESCLDDLGVSPSPEELQQLRLMSIEMARSPAVSRGISNSCGDLWDRLYRRLYGPPPERGAAEGLRQAVPCGQSGEGGRVETAKGLRLVKIMEEQTGVPGNMR